MSDSKKKTIIRCVVFAVILVVFIVGSYGFMRFMGWTDLTQEQIREFVESKGSVAPLIYIGISFLQVTFVPIPAAVTVLAGSYVFGPAMAFVYSYIGMLLGAMVAYFLGKLIGRPFVNWVTGSKENTEIWIKKLNGKENVLLFFMFLFPFFPDDILCSVAGIMPISSGSFFAMQIVTRATSIGATLLFMSGEIIPFEGWGLLVLGAVAVVGIAAFIICFKNAEKINARCAAIVEKLSNLKLFSFFRRR